MNHRKSEVYSGKYLGVLYEIRHWWYFSGRPNWNYYIFLVDEQLPDTFSSLWLGGKRMKLRDKETKHIYYEYKNTIISNLDWHGDCIYYEKVSGFDGTQRVIKVGCDYAHLWDKGKTYRLEDIEYDLKNTIEQLRKLTKVLYRCAYCEEWVEIVNEKEYCLNCENKNENN